GDLRPEITPAPPARKFPPTSRSPQEGHPGTGRPRWRPPPFHPEPSTFRTQRRSIPCVRCCFAPPPASWASFWPEAPRPTAALAPPHPPLRPPAPALPPAPPPYSRAPPPPSTRGSSYAARTHRHWSYRVWSTRYKRFHYYDPYLRVYYYWSAPRGCYYPIDYI